MSLKNMLTGIAAATLAIFASSSAPAACDGGGCECRFTWGSSLETCGNGINFVATCGGQTVGPNLHRVSVSLWEGISSSNIPMTAGGAFFPGACRATDQTKDQRPTIVTCATSLAPARFRVLVG